MARSTSFYTIGEVARRIGENIELLEEVASNSDNVDYGEMIHVQDGTEYSATALTQRGIECVEQLLADIRTSEGSIRQVLVDQKCDPEMIEPCHGFSKLHCCLGLDRGSHLDQRIWRRINRPDT